MDPRNADAHMSLGIVLDRQGDTAGAIASFETSVEIVPTEFHDCEEDANKRGHPFAGGRRSWQRLNLYNGSCTMHRHRAAIRSAC
jgi:hypothetical protein